MKNLMHEKKRQEQKTAEIIAMPIALVLIILFYIIKVLTKILFKFKKEIAKLTVLVFTLYSLFSFFGQVAYAPKADASSPYVKKFNVSLPMEVHPDMRLRETVLSLVAIRFGDDQVNSFDQIVIHESGWDSKAVNPNGGACGLFQALPCSKMKSIDIEDQIDFGFNYIQSRYNTPNNAWLFWQKNHWY